MKSLITHIKKELKRSEYVSIFLGRLSDSKKVTFDQVFKVSEIYNGFYKFEKLNN